MAWRRYYGDGSLGEIALKKFRYCLFGLLMAAVPAFALIMPAPQEMERVIGLDLEVLQDPERFPPPAHVINERGEYLWGKSDLPSRMVARAGRNALSVHFDVPPKEFIFLARKLLGAYTFLHVIEAEIRGNTILEPFLAMNEEEDLALVARKKG